MEQILRDLAQKKLELTRRLMVQTQLWLLNGSEEAFEEKESTLADLQRNDLAIEQCEQEFGTLASEQEVEVYKRIKEVLLSLLELNQEATASLEQDQRTAEVAWRALLSEGAKVSDYVKTNGPYTEARRIKGNTRKRGWQRGYGPMA